MQQISLYLPQFNSSCITNLNFNTMVSFELLEQMRDYVHQFLIDHRFPYSDLQVRLSINGIIEFFCDDCTFLFKVSDSKKDFFLSEFTFSDELPF